MKRIIIAACLLWSVSAVAQSIAPTGGSSLATPVSGANGGTGVANNGLTVTLGASLTTTGAGAPTFAFPATPQTYTWPVAADTLAGLATNQTFTGIDTIAPTATASPSALIWSGPPGLGTNNAAASWTFRAPLSTGTATNPDFIFQTGVKVGSGTGGATATTGLTIKGETQEIQLANGSAATPALAFSADTAGWYRGNPGQWWWSSGANTPKFRLSGGNLEATNSSVFSFDSSTDFSGSLDTGISRDSAGVVAIGTGASGSAAGSMKMTNITASGANVIFSGVTTGTNADFLCLSGGGVVLIQATSCTISSLRFKPDWKPYRGDAIATLSALEVGTFHISGNNRDPNARNLQVGLNAESVARTEPLAAVYEDDGVTPKSYRQEALIALLVEGIRQQQVEIDALKARLDTSRAR